MSNKYLDIAMEKVIKQEVNAVLDKIRAEIEQAKDTDFQRNRKTYDKCLEIIDKYKAESEDEDADKKCTYKETGCGSCKRQLDCPIEADTESEE